MVVYTLKEAARKSQIGMDTLRRACEERLINATKLANGQWRIAESALEEALHMGIDLSALPKRLKKKQPQPPALKRAQEERRRKKQQAA